MKSLLVMFALAPLCALAAAQSAGPAAAGFRCGGIGEAEQLQMKAEAARHDLMLTFALSTGAYLADVDVRIADARGELVLQGRCDGPIMLVDLPARGSYRVTAEAEGRTRHATVNVGGKPARATLVWPVS